MFKALFVSLKLSLFTFACLFTSPTLAQVTSDGTVNTQVNRNGNVAEITGGERRGSNLFHSFQDFSVPTGNEAFFNNNADNISNIFSRVTGGNISNIDGAIRANGSANLFLINPAGIIFGENARLDIGGSFYGSSASSILFEDGEFSVVDNLQQPILTVNAPIGLGFRDEPGDIINRSRVENSIGELAGLEVGRGNTLALVGGDINFESGRTIAKDGNVYLGALEEIGTVSINEDGSLSFPEDLTLANIGLTNAAVVSVAGAGEGNININARNLVLAAGELGSSLIVEGIINNSTSTETQAGDITINIVENINLNGSGIANQIGAESLGNSGNITIYTGSLELTNGSQVTASTFGRGNAGEIQITATGDITLDGEESLNGFVSSISSEVTPGAEGDSKEVTISTTNLNLINGGRVSADTSGQGNAGTVNITATGDITVDGENSILSFSGVTSQVNEDAEGNSGGVTISTTNLNLINGGRIDARTLGQGNAGAVNIEASESIFIDGSVARSRSGIAANAVNQDGNGGDVSISTGNLSIANGGTIEATNFDNAGLELSPGTGRPGSITITADSIELTDNARIETATQFSGEESGIINLNIAENITLRNNSFISAQARNEGNGGNLNIDTNFIIAFPNGNNDIVASAEQGQGGNININAEALFGIEESPLSNRTNDINASSEFNLDGTVNLSTPDVNPVQGATELPTKVIVPEETAQQACEANREIAAKNGFTISGKGGIVPDPKLPLDSFRVTVNGESSSATAIPQSIKTSQGSIQPARGIEVSKSGEIILTAYRTNNAGQRMPESDRNCG